MSFKLYKKHLTIATGRKNAAILSMSYDGARLAGLRWRERPDIEQVRVEALRMLARRVGFAVVDPSCGAGPFTF